jgi:hypothetical protein
MSQMLSPTIEDKFKGIWHRALNTPPPGSLTPELILNWAREKDLASPVAVALGVGAFHPTPSIVLTVEGGKACFPTIPASGDENWRIRRKAHDDQAALWDKVEWFMPLWLPMGEIGKLLASIRHVSRERALELFKYHTSTLYTVPFQAVCIEQIMPLAHGLKEIVPLAREAYLGAYSGYRKLSEVCEAILYLGPPYRQEQFAYGIPVHVGPVLGWQPPKALNSGSRGLFVAWLLKIAHMLTRVSAVVLWLRRKSGI